MRKVASLLMLLLTLANGFSANRYVWSGATGSANGTSWANAWTTVAQITGLADGDRVYFGTGTYNVHDWHPTDGSGFANSIYYLAAQDTHTGPVIFDGQGNGHWLLDCYNVHISGRYNGASQFTLTNFTDTATYFTVGGAYVVIEGVTCYAPFRFSTAYDITLRYIDMTVPNGWKYCVYWNVDKYPTGDTTSYTNSSISYSTFRPARGNDGTGFGPDTVQFGKCFSFHHNVVDPIISGTSATDEHMDGLQNTSAGTYAAIYANVFHNIPNYDIYWQLDDNFVGPLLIYNNAFDNNGGNSSTASSLGVAGVVGPQGINGKTISNVLFANNTLIDKYGRSAIAFGQAGTSNNYSNVRILNNLVFNSGNGSSPAISFENNSGSTNGVTISQNGLLAGASGTTTIYPSQFSAPSGSTITFVAYGALGSTNNLHVTAAPTGANLSTDFTTDADGVTRSAWSIGAYEITGGGGASNYGVSAQGVRLQGGVKIQ